VTKYQRYRLGSLVAVLLPVYFLGGPELRADSLIGDTITANYMHDSTITAFSSILVGPPFPEVTCPGGFSGAGICAAFAEAATINIGALTIDLNENGGAVYGLFTFDGIDFTNLNFGNGDTISGFTLATNLPGLTSSDISFTAHSIKFNAEGLPFPNSYYIDLTLIPTPEPRLLALVLTTLFALAFVARKRIVRTTQVNS
jgi:hypothetical protein